MIKSLRCCPGFQIPHISIQLGICEMCWINKFNPRLPQLATWTWRIHC